MHLALLLMLSSLPRPGVPSGPILPVEARARRAPPEAPTLGPKAPVELDLSLAGDVSRPAPVQTPAPAVSLRPPCACLVVEDPELREAALALLRGWLEQIEKAD